MRMDKFDDAERRLIRKWYFTVLGCYSAVLAAMVAVIVLSHVASNRVAAATQAEMRDHARPAAEQTQLTLNKD
jgi:hypothetical protein